MEDCCSVAQSCPTLCNPMDCSTPGFPVLPSQSPRACSNSFPLSQWCHPTISSSIVPFSSCLPPAFSRIRVFLNELAVCIRWPKYWSFSFSISPSNEYSGLISFRIDRFDLLVVKGTLNSPVPKHQLFCAQPYIWSSSHIHTWLLEKP